MDFPVLHILSGDLWAGAETQVFEQVKALTQAAWPIEVLVFNEGQTADNFRKAGLSVHLIDEKQGFLSLYQQAAKLQQRLGAELLVSHGYKEAFLATLLHLASLRRIPLVTTFHGTNEVHSGLAGFKLKLYLGLQKTIARFLASKITVVSHAMAEELGFADTKKVEVVYNVAGKNSLNLRPSQESYSELSPYIAIVGRLVPVKRVDLALRCFAEFLELEQRLQKDWKLVIIGDGPEEKSLKELSDQLRLGKRVRFLGFVSEAQSLIAQANVLLLTSTSEGVPTVLLEAIQAQTPIISTPLSGVAEIAKLIPEAPITVAENSNPKDLAKKLRQNLSSLPLEVDQQKLILSKFHDTFSPQAAAQKLERIYREIASLDF